MHSDNPLRRAAEILGSQAELAKVCGTVQPHVHKWMARGSLPRTAYTGERDYAERIEAATGGQVTAAELLAIRLPSKTA